MEDIKRIYNLNEKQLKKLEEEIKKVAILTPSTEEDIMDIVKEVGLKVAYPMEELLARIGAAKHMGYNNKMAAHIIEEIYKLEAAAHTIEKNMQAISK